MKVNKKRSIDQVGGEPWVVATDHGEVCPYSSHFNGTVEISPAIPGKPSFSVLASWLGDDLASSDELW